MNIYIYVYIHMYICMNIYIYIYLHVYVYIHIEIYFHICVYMYKYIHIHINISIYTPQINIYHFIFAPTLTRSLEGAQALTEAGSQMGSPTSPSSTHESDLRYLYFRFEYLYNMSGYTVATKDKLC